MKKGSFAVILPTVAGPSLIQQRCIYSAIMEDEEYKVVIKCPLDCRRFGNCLTLYQDVNVQLR